MAEQTIEEIDAEIARLKAARESIFEKEVEAKEKQVVNLLREMASSDRLSAPFVDFIKYDGKSKTLNFNRMFKQKDRRKKG